MNLHRRPHDPSGAGVATSKLGKGKAVILTSLVHASLSPSMARARPHRGRGAHDSSEDVSMISGRCQALLSYGDRMINRPTGVSRP